MDCPHCKAASSIFSLTIFSRAQALTRTAIQPGTLPRERVTLCLKNGESILHYVVPTTFSDRYNHCTIDVSNQTTPCPTKGIWHQKTRTSEEFAYSIKCMKKAETGMVSNPSHSWNKKVTTGELHALCSAETKAMTTTHGAAVIEQNFVVLWDSIPLLSLSPVEATDICFDRIEAQAKLLLISVIYLTCFHWIFRPSLSATHVDSKH